MIAFVVALQSEAEFFLDNITDCVEFSLCSKKAFKGKLVDKDVVLALSGIGKVNASLTTQKLIDEFSPDLIINFGTCGGVNNNVSVGNFYIVDKCCQFDFDVSELDPVPVGYIQDYNSVYFYPKQLENCKLKIASLASADRFSDSVSDNKLINDMDCFLRDMEGGAIGEVCTANNLPFVLIKGVTDVYGSGTSGEQFYKNLKAICFGFKKVIPEIINLI